jgi:nucleoside-diphosphate-sugar epimerase
MRDLDGRTFLITGANTGIGRATTEALATRGATVYMACRSQPRARAARDEIVAATGNDDLHLLSLDLGDLASVHACADSFLQTGAPLHVLINNAGLAGRRGTTASGFELAFGTNHVGPFALTNLLLDRLRESAPARIVTVSSRGLGRDHLLAAPRDDRLRRLARGPVADPAAIEDAHAFARRGGADIAVLRHRARAWLRHRALLRRLPSPRAQPPCDAGARR